MERQMQRADAIKKLGKLLGKNLGYRIADKAPTREERATAKAALTIAIAERNKLKEQKDARYRAILAADAEYQSLFANYKAASEHVDVLASVTRHYKIAVGISNSMFFHIKAEGDSWEEIIEQLTKKQAA
jgi:hypothetical protein